MSRARWHNPIDGEWSLRVGYKYPGTPCLQETELDYVLIFRGSCILVGPFDYIKQASDRLISKLTSRKDIEAVEIRHRLAADVIEFPDELQHMKKEIGA